MSDVILRRIHKSFGKTEVLHGIDLEIRSGEFVALLGASGCGKTTLLRIVAGLESATEGTVEIGGEDVTALPPERRDIAMMFQSYALLPHLDVVGNVRFPLRMRSKAGRAEQEAQVAAALETVQLAHLARRMPSQLSGGQQQRVALARAIVSRPKVLLLDEPLSNLDARLREEMQVELIEIHRRLGLTTIFVTHDQDEALSLADRVVLLNGGRIEQQGAPREIYMAPDTAFASSFLGAANLIPVTVASSASSSTAQFRDGQSLPLPVATAAGPALLMLRQEDAAVRPAGSPGTVAATVVMQVYLGGRSRLVLDLAGQRINVTAPADLTVEPGATVALAVSPERLRLLPPAP